MKSIIPALAVADIEASIRFYTEVLGFSTQMTLPGPDGSLVHASLGRGEVSVMFSRIDPAQTHDQAPLGRGVALYATVGDDEDVDALFAHARAAGTTVTQEPTDQFWGMRDFGIADPDGYVWLISKETAKRSEAEMREAMLTGAPAD
jgi:uncharacterized glyoxalase superfamily protein PhnB